MNHHFLVVMDVLDEVVDMEECPEDVMWTILGLWNFLTLARGTARLNNQTTA